MTKEIEDLKSRLAEAEETLEAIRSGGVDALVVYGEDGELIYMLQGAEHPYRVMVETMNEGAVSLSQEGIVLYANAGLANMLDIPLESILGSQLDSLIIEQDREKFKAILAQGLQEKSKIELALHAADGSEIPVQLSFGPIRTRDMKAICAVATDLSQQKLKEIQKLQKSEKRYRQLFESMNEGFILFEIEGDSEVSPDACRCIDVNPAFERITGFDRENIIGKTAGNILQDLDPHWSEHITRVASTGESKQFEIYSSTISKYLSGNSFQPAERQCALVFEDITDRKMAEEALRQTNETLEARVRERTQEITELQRRLIDSVEDERQRVSQELHDGPMQEIYGLIYGLNALKGNQDPAEWHSSLDFMQDKLNQINEWLRMVVRDLRPTSLIHFGLEKGIREHASQFQQEHSDLQVNLNLRQDGTTIATDLRIALFRIYSGALANVVRHSQARQVDIRLDFDDRSVFLEVEDDGCGFRVPASWLSYVRDGHLGLAGAAERAEAFGGKLEVDSEPGRGTRLRVEIPRHAEHS